MDLPQKYKYKIHGVQLEVLSYSKNHIDSIIKSDSDDGAWRLTGFYDEPETSRRIDTLGLLKGLAYVNILPWLCLGDFNELISQYEKLGGALRHGRQMELFRSKIFYCGYLELPYTGSRFTWHRGSDEDVIFERLARFFYEQG